jgi:serine/threonine-protein kinase RsbW
MATKIFPGIYASLADIAGFVKNSAIEAGFSLNEVFTIETAVDEAVSNIIEHAYNGENKGDIVCKSSILKNGIEIVLEDHGKPFDPSCIPIPNLKAALEDRSDTGGLGYYMMCQMVDEVRFDFNEKRNRLTMIKYKV